MVWCNWHLYGRVSRAVLSPLTERDRKKFSGVLDEVIGFPYMSEMFSRERYDKQNNYVLFSE